MLLTLNGWTQVTVSRTESKSEGTPVLLGWRTQLWRHASAIALLLMLLTTIATPLVARSTRAGNYLVTQVPPARRVFAYLKSAHGGNATRSATERASSIVDGWTPVLAMFAVAGIAAAQTSTSSWLAGQAVTKKA